MYIPGIFKIDDINTIREFLKRNGFGILINLVEGKLWATHIPMLLTTDSDEKDILTGHISKLNKQWKAFENNADVLAVFPGPHTYVSSSWYDHENVPTWNYLAVHIYGNIRIIEGEELKEQLSAMVRKYESVMPNPVSFEKMSESYVHNAMKGIVGFTINISEVQAAMKLSQNRDDNNHRNIIDGLIAQGDQASLEIAGIMKRNRKKS